MRALPSNSRGLSHWFSKESGVITAFNNKRATPTGITLLRQTSYAAQVTPECCPILRILSIPWSNTSINLQPLRSGVFNFEGPIVQLRRSWCFFSPVYPDLFGLTIYLSNKYTINCFAKSVKLIIVLLEIIVLWLVHL